MIWPRHCGDRTGAADGTDVKLKELRAAIGQGAIGAVSQRLVDNLSRIAAGSTVQRNPAAQAQEGDGTDLPVFAPLVATSANVLLGRHIAQATEYPAEVLLAWRGGRPAGA